MAGGVADPCTITVPSLQAMLLAQGAIDGTLIDKAMVGQLQSLDVTQPATGQSTVTSKTLKGNSGQARSIKRIVSSS